MIPAKKSPEMSSAQVICCIYLFTLLTNVSVKANNVDQDQSAPIGEV